MTPKFKLMAATLLASTALVGAAQAQALNSNPLSDPRVRQAINYAIDMDTIAETLFEGAAIPAAGLLPKGPFKPDDLNPYSYDPEKAKALLAEAGWDSNTVLDVAYYYTDQQTADLMAALQAYLGDVGIKMEYRLLEGDIGSQTGIPPEDPINGPSVVKWDLLYGARAALALQEYYNRYGPGLSPTVPNVPEMNALVATVNGTSDPEAQREAYFALERLNGEMLYEMPLYWQQLYTYESDRLNRNGAPYGNEQFNYDWAVETWTVTPDASGKSVLYTNMGPQQFFELPWQNLGIWASSKFVFDTLLEANGSLSEYKGEIFESWEVSDDELTFTFKLRPGLTWHDGAPITTADVAWSLSTALKVALTQPVLKSTLNSIAGAADYAEGKSESLSGLSYDDSTLTLTLSKIDPNILLSLSQFHPLPMASFEGVDPMNIQQAPFWQNPIGSGPFKVSEVKMGDYMTLIPNESYFRGTPKIEMINVRPSMENDGALLVNATAGKADFGYTKAAADVPALEALPQITVHPIDIPYTRILFINQFPKPAK